MISAINAVTLKPAQCAVDLCPPKKKKNLFYRSFNRVYGWSELAYVAIIRLLVRWPYAVMLAFAGLVALTLWWYHHVPTGFMRSRIKATVSSWFSSPMLLRKTGRMKPSIGE